MYKKTTRKFNSGAVDGTRVLDEVDWNWSTG